MISHDFEEAQLLRNNGEIELALKKYLAVRQKASEEGNQEMASECLHMIGVAHYQEGKYPDAIKNLTAALSEFQEQGEENLSGAVFRDLGLVALRMQDLSLAEQYMKQSIEVFQKAGNIGHEGISRVKLGNIYADRKIFNAALSAISEGISLLEQTTEYFFLSSAYFDLAKVYKEDGKISDAKDAAQKSQSVLNTFAQEHQFIERRRALSSFLHDIEK